MVHKQLWHESQYLPTNQSIIEFDFVSLKSRIQHTIGCYSIAKKRLRQAVKKLQCGVLHFNLKRVPIFSYDKEISRRARGNYITYSQQNVYNF